MRFMDQPAHDWQGDELWISRSGYTGEDGFEISVPAAPAGAASPARCWPGQRWRPSALARATVCGWRRGCRLYGHDIDPTTSPVEAALGWSIQKARRSGGARAGGFPGAGAGPATSWPRVPRASASGCAPRAARRCARASRFTPPMGRRRAGGDRHARAASGHRVSAPDRDGLCRRRYAAPGTRLQAEVRGKRLPVRVTALPFVSPNFKR